MISEDTQNALFIKSAGQLANIRELERPSTIGISKVSTFIAKKSFSSFVVPPFAVHWGVVVDFSSRRYLYHLVFMVETREVYFQAISWESHLTKHSVIPVGTTLYGMEEVDQIGNKFTASSLITQA